MYQFVTTRNDELGVDGVVSFNETAVPARSDGAGRQRPRIIRGNPVAEKNVVLAVHVKRLDVELLQEPPAVGTDPRETAIAFCFDGRTPAGQKVGRGHPEVAEQTDALDAKTAGLEAFVKIDESVIGPSRTALTSAGQARISIDTAEEGDRIAGVAVLRVTGHLNPNLVVADAAKSVDVSHERSNAHGRRKVIVVPGASDTGEGEEALFGQEHIQFELAEFQIQPR